uniref:transposase n=1 Tax=Arcobacter sp. TaxID=1872629 RepID=UPI003D0FDA6F
NIMKKFRILVYTRQKRLSREIIQSVSVKSSCSGAQFLPPFKSGSSVKGRSRISKIGNGKLRNLLFMSSFNTCKYNKACRAIYERLVAKGKSKKLALIAVCNKLLKQAFAIAKSGLVYDQTYRSVLEIN